MNDDTVNLAQQLIAQASVTPDDKGCQALMEARLQAIDFKYESMPFGEVKNFWARRGRSSPLLVFAGHTDVVPPGPLEKWKSPPFEPAIREGVLYGRGAADMKGSLAAMITACERFVKNHPAHRGSIAFLVTSDEEGPSINGTRKVVEALQKRGETMDWCLVGEPSSSKVMGDTVKNGRRGSFNGILTVHGTQGHVAYPQLADNPIHRFAPALAELTSRVWDQGHSHFPATSFQISNINAGTGADNVIPSTLQVIFNFRYSPAVTHEQLRAQVEEILENHQLDYDINWRLSGEPFITESGELIDAVCKAIETVTGLRTQLSTAGGTSDGRFIAPLGVQVVELGPINATIHQINECVSVRELIQLSQVYEQLMVELLT